MAWEQHSSPAEGYTLWHDAEQKMWRVSLNYKGCPCNPANDLNHPSSKKAALESWRAGRSLAEMRKNNGGPAIKPGTPEEMERRKKLREAQALRRKSKNHAGSAGEFGTGNA